MIRRRLSIPVFFGIFAFALLLCNCSNPIQGGNETATFSINLGGDETGRLVYGPGTVTGAFPTHSDLTFVVIFAPTAASTGIGKTFTENGPSSSIIRGNVEPGEYDIIINISLKDFGTLYATGGTTTPETISAGHNEITVAVSMDPDARGTGSQMDPFKVYDAYAMQRVGRGGPGGPGVTGEFSDWTLGSSYRLMRSITLPAGNWTPIGNTTTPFTGTFDGNDFTISGLRITGSSPTQGLFGAVNNATIENLGLTNIIINVTSGSIGGLVGNIQGTNHTAIKNCYVTGSITASSSIGGIVGQIAGNATVEYCYTDVAINGSSIYLGGIVGSISTTATAIVSSCYSTGNITSPDNGIGGIVGSKGTGTVRNCYATGNIQGNNSIGGIVGSISAGNSGIVEYCYSTGNITSSFNGPSTDFSGIGGVVGFISASFTGTVQYCVALNKVITVQIDHNSRIGRVAGIVLPPPSFVSVKARDDMNVNIPGGGPLYNTNADRTLTGKDGENVAVTPPGGTLNSSVFDGWSLTVWDIPAGSLSNSNTALPTLIGVSAVPQNPRLP